MGDMKKYYLGKERWHNRTSFPLLPLINIRKKDVDNTFFFSFRWLFFKVWTLNAFSFQLSIVADTNYGIGLIGLLPYLQWSITIPFPEKIGFFIDERLNRKFWK